MSLGPGEIVVLFILGLLVFGPKKLPEVGRTLGEVLRDLKRMSSDVTSAFEDAMEEKPERSTSHEWEDPYATRASQRPEEEGTSQEHGSELHGEAAPQETDAYRRNVAAESQGESAGAEKMAPEADDNSGVDAEEIAVRDQEVQRSAAGAAGGKDESATAERTQTT